MNTDTRKQIETALRTFSGAGLREVPIGLLKSLGYQSEKTLDLGSTPDALLAEFDLRNRKFRKDKALIKRRKAVESLIHQLSQISLTLRLPSALLVPSIYRHTP